MKNDKNEKLFDLINSSMLNNYLNSYFERLTAKIWRTFNASIKFQDSLNSIKTNILKNMKESDKLTYLISMIDKANIETALLCNHQKILNLIIVRQLLKT